MRDPARMERARTSVAVITGASSGIGRATAMAFARRGTTVVLAARRAEALEEVAAECRAQGVGALTVPTDTADEEAVWELARRAVAELGGFDVWVNNAGVYLLGRFDETPPEAFRRVVEVDFFGMVYGARAALAHFRTRGRGVLINNSSLLGGLGSPYLSAYAAAKWAIRGFGESLRLELLDEPDIHVCTVRPASIDTPLFQHAANYTGRKLKPLSPVYPVEKAAKAIVRLAERPKREVIVGGAGRFIALQRALAPALVQRAFAKQVERDHFEDAPAPGTDGNLFQAVAEPTGASGGWRNGRVPMRRVAAAAVAVAVPAAVVAVLRR